MIILVFYITDRTYVFSMVCWLHSAKKTEIYSYRTYGQIQQDQYYREKVIDGVERVGGGLKGLRGRGELPVVTCSV